MSARRFDSRLSASNDELGTGGVVPSTARDADALRPVALRCGGSGSTATQRPFPKTAPIHTFEAS